MPASRSEHFMAQKLEDFDNLECVVQPATGSILFDVVAIHGLSSTWQDTWSSQPQSRSWLRDLLPKEIPNARVWTYGYDVREHISHDLIASRSQSLLDSFETQREDPKRPVIFIAHSLGGIVLQDALQKSSNALRNSIHGIVFLGLPQFGCRLKIWERFLVAIEKGLNQTPPSSQTTSRNVLQLGLINVGFIEWLPQQSFAHRIVCFYEVLPVTKIGIVGPIIFYIISIGLYPNRQVQIVEKEFATIPYCDSIALYANHFSMTKFPTGTDRQYQTVMQSVRMMCCLADKSKVLMRRSLAVPSHGRLRNMPSTPDGCEELMASCEGSSEAKNCGRLALMLEDQGYYDEALEQYSSAAKLYKDSVGPTHRLTLFCLDKRALLLRDRGEYKDAETLGRSILKSRIDVYEKTDLATLTSCGNLALTLVYEGDNQAAYSLVRDALEGFDSAHLEEVSQVKLLDVLAKIATECGMYDIAESIACDVVRISISIFGKGHPFTMNRISDLAVVMAWKNQFTAAEAVGRHALGGLQQACGKNHPDSLRASQRLADYVRCQCRYNDAATRLELTLSAQKRKPGTRHPDTLSTMSSLGHAYALQGYLKSAEELLSCAHAGQIQVLGPRNRCTMWTSHTLTAVKALQKSNSGKPESSDDTRPSVWLESLGYRSGPGPRQDNQIDKHIGSPFTNAQEDSIINAAVAGDLTCLQTSFDKNELDSHFTGRALRQAAACGQNGVIELLLGTDSTAALIDAPGGFYGTAIQAASFAGKETTVEFLLSRGANINVRGGIFGNALRVSVLCRQTQILQLLLNKDRCPRSTDVEVLNSSLEAAIATNQADIISQLLESGADVNAKDNLFGSPLQQAAFAGRENLMALLIMSKADVNLQAGVFQSPLQAAIACANQSTVKLLLDRGALVRRSYFEPGNNMTDQQRAIHEQLLEKMMDEMTDDTDEASIDSTAELTAVQYSTGIEADVNCQADSHFQSVEKGPTITDAEATRDQALSLTSSPMVAAAGFQQPGFPGRPNPAKAQSGHTANFTTTSSSSKTSRFRRCVMNTSHNVKERMLGRKQRPKRYDKRYITSH